MEGEVQPRRLWWMRWMALTFVVLGGIFIASLFFAPKPLIVKGSLITPKGPMAAGTYDFRLKFYEATTRVKLVSSYDVKDVPVDTQGSFKTSLPTGNDLKVATLMQVCIASSQAAPGMVVRQSVTLLSCTVPQQASTVTAVFNQTICGLTAVDQNPTNLFSRLATKNTVYATPTKPCGGSDGTVASVSDKDVVTPLLKAPGSLSDLLGGVNLQPGTVLTVGADGQVVGLPPAEVVGDVVREEIAKHEAQNPHGPVTDVFDSSPTAEDSQTLTLSGNVLSISGGNSVTLPEGGGAEEDGIIGNEITDVIAGSGLVRVGAGTTLDPLRVGLITCANGEVIKSTGPGAWGCAVDTDTTYSPGTGISFAGTTINNSGVLSFALPAGGGLTNTGSGQNVSLKIRDCANGEVLQFNAGTWVCVLPGSVSPYSFAITDNTTTEPILNGNTVTFVGNEGLLATVTATDSVTYGIVNGGVTTLKLADGSVNAAKIADGTITTIDLSDGSVTNSKLANNSLTVAAGAGLSGGGVVALGAATTLNLQACANGQILKHNGTTWACAADNSDPNTDNQTLSIVASAPDGANTVAYDLSISGGNTISFNDRNTLYTAATSGGLALSGTAFSLQTCPVGQLLKSTNASTPTYACATDVDTDTNTTYTAGTGLSLVGTTFNNTGVLGVTGSGAITSTGGQNPNIAFANGSVTGQFWQWDGDSWELATLAAEQDAVIGNEVTNVTGAASGLTRSGAGTAVSPYTLAANVGNGIQITSNAISVNSPTCAGTDKLQWTGTVFVCSADVDTDTNTTYTADGQGIELASTVFSLELNGTSLAKSASGLTLNLSNANTWAALQTFGAGATVTAGQTLTVNGDAFTDLTGTGLTIAGGALQTTLGTSVDLTTEVTNTLGVTNGGTGLAALGTANRLLGVNAAGTALEYKDLSSLLVAGSGISLSGTNTVTITNTGAAATCVVTSNYACNGGNTLAAALTLGTNDANSLIFETNNATAMTILSGGNVGIGVSPTEKLDVNGNINIPATTASTGIVKQAGARFIHSFGGVTNFFAGTNAGNLTLTGLSNTGVGADSLKNLTTGSSNNALGISALEGMTTGSNNTGMGSFALQDNTGGSNNSALGWGTLANSLNANNNSAFGANALQNNVAGSFNVAMGAQALQNNTAGANTAVGNNALGLNISGDGNVALGYAAGITEVSANANTTGANNTFIGLNAGPGSTSQLVRSSAIGAHSIVSQNDSLVLGCIGGINGCSASTKVGIGIAAPLNLVHMDGGAADAVVQATTTATGQTSTDGLLVGLQAAGTALFLNRESQTMFIGTSNAAQITILGNGNVGISNASPGFQLHVGSAANPSGTAVARFQNAGGTCTVTPNTAGGITCTSDERLKKNIEDFSGAIDIVNQVDIKKFNMVADAEGTPQQIGVIAQQLEKVLPGLVQTDKEGYKSVSYAALAPIILQAVKEQQVELNQLKRSVWNGGVVTKDTTFLAATIFNGPARFTGGATFTGDVTIMGKVKLSGDQVNQTVLRAGRRQAVVVFGGGYPRAPYITATPRELVNGSFRVTKVTTTGFVIELQQPQPKDVRFDWHAFAKQ